MNVQHQYKSVLGTAAAIAAAVMGENGHSCDGESHMAGGGRRVDALVPPVGRHGCRFLPSSPWSRYRHPPARPTMHVTGSRSPREAVSEWGADQRESDDQYGVSSAVSYSSSTSTYVRTVLRRALRKSPVRQLRHQG